MNIIGLLIVLLVLGAVFPIWGYNNSWGYGPFGGLAGILILIIVVLFLTGRL